MEENTLVELKQSFDELTGLFSVADTANLLCKHNTAIVICLEYIKAKDWPWRGLQLVNEPVKRIPLIWAVFDAPNCDNIRMVWDIHPTKCFPNRYKLYNPNMNSSSISIVKSNGVTLAGCSRFFVKISNRRYEVTEKNPEYCAIFGLPDDCYDPSFEKRMLDNLRSYKKLDLWCFEKTEFLNEQIEPVIKLHYMKGEFLPARNFIYVDTPEHFLTGVYKSKQLRSLSTEFWYSTGRELIEEMNLGNKLLAFRFEEKANYYIRKRLIFEFVRLSLLLAKKRDFSSFQIKGSPQLQLNRMPEVQTRLQSILTLVKKDYTLDIDDTIKKIKTDLDMQSLRRSHFMVMDVEYIHVPYPTPGRQGFFNFPCIFCSIIWRGVGDGLNLNTNVFSIPCHICRQPCKIFKQNLFDFNCLIYGFEFIEEQVSLLEEMLTKYDGFKIYTFGRGDAFQLEQGSNFFTDSFEKRRYQRRNRKRAQRLTDISEDISTTGIGLKEIEQQVLGKWLVGSIRKQKKVNVNSRFMTRYGDPRWEANYFEAISSCVSDTVSAFFYLIYMKYRAHQ